MKRLGSLEVVRIVKEFLLQEAYYSINEYFGMILAFQNCAMLF